MTLVNTYLVNEFEVWHSVAPLAVTQDDLVFNGYGLQNTSIILEISDHDDLGKIDFNTFDFPRNNGGGVISKYYRGRSLHFKGVAKASSASALNDLIDAIKYNLSKTDGYLDIKVNWEIRRVKATNTQLQFGRQHYHVTFVPVAITFQILEPFFYTITEQSASYLSKVGDFSEEFTNLWTAPSDPILYFIFSAGASVTAITITNYDGTQLTITNTFSVSDVLIIDSKNKLVTKNGTDIDYTGVFPIFRVGSNPFSVDFTGTVAVDLSVISAKNYL